ncbi:MAG TPA: exonuclease domain-containing protein [Longimicrobiaceae bacterium]|nr:exonuclease domain-containing protein [Longimicrobiaceae bacterium]
MSSGAPAYNDVLRFERGGTLTDRAHRLLERGPLDTAVLASQVLGISGDPRAAAGAVFALLGTDPRFTVSPEGVWSLGAAALPRRLLREERFVVVDVETTGGAPGSGHRVTEIAAVCVEGGEIRETFSTLVNPGRRIPSMIVSLTGITDRMVADAPRFGQVADRVLPLLEGRVFVAHNAPFDWRFVCAELERATGMLPVGRQLCTVKLARKLLPQLPSRSLDGLALYYGLEIESRHRALDDAVATAKVLLRFLDVLEERGVVDWDGMDVFLGRRTPRRKRTATPRSMDSA